MMDTGKKFLQEDEEKEKYNKLHTEVNSFSLYLMLRIMLKGYIKIFMKKIYLLEAIDLIFPK
jgi:hypothetical protein